MVVMTRGAWNSRIGMNRRKSAAAKLRFAPMSRSIRSRGPKNPLR